MRAAPTQCGASERALTCGAAVALAVLFSVVAFAQPVRYVDVGAPAGGDGTSWATAYNDLQAALTSITPPTELRVAAGVYRPDGGAGDRSLSFDIADGVQLRGGYAGSAGADPNARDLVAFETVLSGAIGDVLSRGDNSYRVVTLSGVSAATVLDGVTIADGNADGSSPANSGAGAFIDGGTPLFRQVTLRDHRGDTGGAIFMQGLAAPRFEQCLFVDNAASDNGGAVFVFTGAPEFSGCVFQRNTADVKGGALATLFANWSADDCRFIDNLASNRGGAVSTSGGEPVLRDCRFENNTVANGGGSEATGGGLAIESGVVDVSRGAWIGNFTLDDGGGLAVLGGTVTLSQCVLRGNTTLDRGGAIAVAGGSLLLRSAALVGNEAFRDGGAIFQNGGDLALLACTVAANVSGEDGGGVYIANGACEINSSILWANQDELGGGEAAQIGYVGFPPTVSHACITGLTGALGGVGNVDLDPLFYDFVGDDGVAGTGDEDLRLAADSPCIDAGDPSAHLLVGEAAVDNDDANDLAGGPRVVCDIIDMGAYEAPPALGDLDCDRDVDHADYLLWLACLTGPDGSAGIECDAADADADADVDLADLLVFQTRFADAPNAPSWRATTRARD